MKDRIVLRDLPKLADLPKQEDTNVRKVVINACYGGFSLSHEGIMEYAKIKGIDLYVYTQHTYNDPYREAKGEAAQNSMKRLSYFTKPLKDGKYDNEAYFGDREIERDDPALVQVVEKIGNKADGWFAKLKVVEIPADAKWEIDEYDGNEHVQEQCRKWC